MKQRGENIRLFIRLNNSTFPRSHESRLSASITVHVIFSDGTSRGSVSNDADLAETTETLCSQSTCDSYEDHHLVLASAVTRAHNSSPANSGVAFPQTAVVHCYTLL